MLGITLDHCRHLGKELQPGVYGNVALEDVISVDGGVNNKYLEVILIIDGYKFRQRFYYPITDVQKGLFIDRMKHLFNNALDTSLVSSELIAELMEHRFNYQSVIDNIAHFWIIENGQKTVCDIITACIIAAKNGDEFVRYIKEIKALNPGFRFSVRLERPASSKDKGYLHIPISQIFNKKYVVSRDSTGTALLEPGESVVNHILVDEQPPF